MKILILNSSDINGGAARATYRIHRCLVDAGIDSKMLVIEKKSSDPTVLESFTKVQKFIYKVRQKIDGFPIKFYPKKTKSFFSCSIIPLSNLVPKVNKLNPDVVHLHWICDSMFNIHDLIKIKAPIVWGLLDMWAFTGGCHYDENCGRYKLNCGKCKVLGSKSEIDLSRILFNKKQAVYSKLKNFTIVGHSKWLAQSAQESSLLNNHRVLNIPSAINSNLFQPQSKMHSRNIWKLPQDKKLILYGATYATSEPRKGYKELIDSLNYLKSTDVEFIVFGGKKPNSSEEHLFNTHYLGTIENDQSLVSLYNSADVMVVPSLQENLSNAILESLSCGIPVVAFNIGGNSDMIEHKKNGYLANPFSTSDLANGIDWVLNQPNYYQLCDNARKKILTCFDGDIVSKQYIRLYEDVINKSSLLI